MNPLLEELQSTWHERIPISAEMGIGIVSFDGGEFVVAAALAPNVNVHGTAFAGSLYSVCALTGWGMAWLLTKKLGIDAAIVMAEGRITYRRPVAGDFECRCLVDTDATAELQEALGDSGTAKVPLTATVESRGKLAVRFDGTYSISVSAD